MIDRLHLRWQVVLCVAVVQLAALGLGGAVLLKNAREAVVVEMQSAESGARAQVIAAVGAALRDHPPAAAIAALAERLVEPRHVRLALVDARLGPMPVRARQGGDGPGAVPDWFNALVIPPVRETRLPIVDRGIDYGFVSLTMAPEDEIAEVWRDVSALFWTLGAGVLATGAVLIVLIRRSLAPLQTLNRGLAALQEGRLATRISGVRGPDFGPIVDGFNALSQGLEASESQRAALARKIVELGDAERRAIAMELHDEFGPCLFGLRVKAGAIVRAADRAGDPVLRRDAETVASIVDQIQTANTRLLTTLRPMTVGQLPLVEALGDMLAGFRSTHPGIGWDVCLPETLPETEEIVDLTVYRFVQEGVTNALRHGTPRRVRVALGLAADGAGGPALGLTVEDDGRGLSEAMVEGRGLTAMRDRVYAIGGRLVLGARPGGGTRLSALLPLVPSRRPLAPMEAMQ